MSDESPPVPPASPRHVLSFSPEERRALANALMARPQRRRDGRAAIQRAYPAAPEAMAGTAAHHLYGDGVEAAIDLLAAAELMLREPTRDLDDGAVYHLAYHLYNWMQFVALLPHGRHELLDLVAQLKQAVEENDMEFIKHTAELLDDVVGGHVSHPEVERP